MTHLSNGFSLERTTNNVLKLKQDVGKGIIAIGQHLEIAKENLLKKEFSDWLRNDVKIHRTTAYRYMRVAKQVDYETLERLGPSKVYEIVEAPMSEEERQGLIQRAENMTVREIRDEKEKQRNLEEPLVHQTETELPKEIDELLNDGIDFVERLEKISFLELPENWKRFSKSQLMMIGNVVKDISEKL